MKEIKLSRGRIALVDDNDFGRINAHKWHLNNPRHCCYAERNVPMKNGNGFTAMRMHREIMNAPDGMEVDHIDGNGLNNQKSNLRLCTHSQNQANRKMQKNNRSGFRGVSWRKRERRWAAVVSIDGKRRYLGYFISIYDAAKARDNVVASHFGDFAKLNFPVTVKIPARKK